MKTQPIAQIVSEAIASIGQTPDEVADTLGVPRGAVLRACADDSGLVIALQRRIVEGVAGWDLEGPYFAADIPANRSARSGHSERSPQSPAKAEAAKQIEPKNVELRQPGPNGYPFESLEEAQSAMNELTEKQYQVLYFVREHERQTGRVPYYREVQEYFGFPSPNTVTQRFRVLRKRGYLPPA